MMYAIIIAGIILLGLFSVRQEDTDSFNAAFGNAGDHLSTFNMGFAITGGMRALTREVSYKNALIIGQSGSGKTSTVLIGSVFTLSRGNNSVAIMDVSGEIFQLTSGYLASQGYKIICIDFGENSDGFNPLSTCKTPNDIQRVAQILVKNSNVESKSDQFWSTAGEMMLSTFMQYLLFYAEPQYHSMANVLAMIETFAAEPEKIDKLFVKVDEKLLRSYKALVATPDRTLQSIISTAIATLKIFKNPAVARCTAFNTINIPSMRMEKTALFICIPVNQVNFLAPISALLFESLFQEMLSRIPDKNECACFFLLDELVTMRFQNLGIVYSNCRKYRCGCMGLIQDERMLEMNYSSAEAHAIKTNSFSKVYLQGQPLGTSLQLQEALGQRIVINEKGIEKRVHLMEAPAIRMSKEAIIFLGAELPLKEKMHPYYNHFVFNNRTKITPYQAIKKIPFDEPPIIPLD
ncbi:type IV secretory system conjugative DNA transfer family protein [Ferruginibacter sp.]